MRVKLQKGFGTAGKTILDIGKSTETLTVLPMTDDLFREEAVRHRTRALYGEVILAGPLSLWVITALLVLIFIGLVCFGLFGTIELTSGPVPIWKWAFGLAG